MHRGDGRSASFWRVQYVRNGFENRWKRLFAALSAGKIDRGKSYELGGGSRCTGAASAPFEGAEDRIAEDQDSQCQRRIFPVGYNRTDQKRNRADQRDSGRCGVPPRAIGPIHFWFAPAKREVRQVGKGVVGHKEKGKHTNDALERAKNKNDSDDRAEEQGKSRSSARVYPGKPTKEETIATHHMQGA